MCESEYVLIMLHRAIELFALNFQLALVLWCRLRDVHVVIEKRRCYFASMLHTL